MNAYSAINAYKKVGTESKVAGADPHQLTSMLYHGAIERIASAKSEIMRNDFAAKGVFISKAIAIIGEGLHASLDKKVGGELAENMSSLYEYMVKRLIDANLKNDITILDEVSGLLGELAGAWDSIRPNYIQPGSQLMGSANAQLAYRRA